MRNITCATTESPSIWWLGIFRWVCKCSPTKIASCSQIKSVSSLASFCSSFIFNFYAISTFIYPLWTLCWQSLTLSHSDSNSIRSFQIYLRVCVWIFPGLAPEQWHSRRSDVFVIYQKQMEVRMFNRFLNLNETEGAKINSGEKKKKRIWIVRKWIQVLSLTH